MIGFVYIILLVLLYGYTAGYFLKNHENYKYLESENAAFNFRYISMIILNLLVGYVYYSTILEDSNNKLITYYGIILIGLIFVIIARYKSESSFVNELASSYLPLLIAIFTIFYIGIDALDDQSISVKLIAIVIFVYCLTVLLTSNPHPFNLKSIKNMEKSSGLITLIPANEIYQIDATNSSTVKEYELDYENLDSFALVFNIYIESSGLKSISDVSYNIITLETNDISANRGYNIDFTINYDYVEKNLVLNFSDSSFNNFITNAIPTPEPEPQPDTLTCWERTESFIKGMDVQMCADDTLVNKVDENGNRDESTSYKMIRAIDPGLYEIQSQAEDGGIERHASTRLMLTKGSHGLPSDVSPVVNNSLPPVENNSYIIPITFNNNNLYKWHHILLNFNRSGIDIYSSNNNDQVYKIDIDPLSKNVTGFNNYGNKLIKQIKFINPGNYLDYNFKTIKIGNENNLGNDYISLSKMNFYSREINYEELDKINNI